MTGEESYRHALEVLQGELGADGLARFLRLTQSGGVDYTRDRRQWLDNLSLGDVFQSISTDRNCEK